MFFFVVCIRQTCVIDTTRLFLSKCSGKQKILLEEIIIYKKKSLVSKIP